MKTTTQTHEQTLTDLKHAVLVMSVFANTFVLVTVLVAKLSPYYAAQLVSML